MRETDGGGTGGRRWRIALSWVTGAMAVGVLHDVLLARAGGGGNFGGGGGGGGGGSGGGDDWFFVFWLCWKLLQLCYYYPYVGIPLVLLIGVGVMMAGKGSKGVYQSRVIRRGTAAEGRGAAGVVAARVREADPAFNADAFVARARDAFMKIQRAWGSQDLTPVRPFISDAVYERFTLQFAEQRALGFRNVLDNAEVREAALAHGEAGRAFDEVSVRFVGYGVDRKVSLKDASDMGNDGGREFAEVWTFLRKRGAKTKAGKPGLIEGNCPNCGGAVEMNQSAKCGYCGAALRSGEYDWVLAEITQECEWSAGRRAALPGVGRLLARDPGFNVQELEDRASVVFWRRAEAERLNSAGPLRKVATTAYCDTLDAKIATHKGQERWYVGECGVGSVDVQGIVPAGDAWTAGPACAQPAAEFDRAVVEVRWSGTRFDAAASGKLTRGDATAVSHLLLVLARKAGAVSDPGKAVSSAHCPTCAGPMGDEAEPACTYCGTVLNDGASTWALEEAVGASSSRGRAIAAALRDVGIGETATGSEMPGGADGESNGYAGAYDDRALADAGSPAAALAWMIKVSFADGEIDDRERALLADVAARRGVPEARVDQMLAAARAGELDVPTPEGRDQARTRLKAIATMALADGRIAKQEAAMLRQAGNQLGLSDHDLRRLIKQTKGEMYRHAKGVLREAKRKR